MGPSPRLAVVSCIAALALVGCGDDAPDPPPSPSDRTTTATPSPSTSTPQPTTASPTPTASLPPLDPAGFSLEGRTSPTFPNLGGELGAIGQVRVGHHSGYDRVVWEFAGTGRPTYKVHYVDRPLGDGSGDPVTVKGKAYVEVLVTTVGIPAELTPRPRNAPATSLAGTVISQAFGIYGGFEGYGQTFIGIRDKERPLRVTTLTNPTRLVVDVDNG